MTDSISNLRQLIAWIDSLIIYILLLSAIAGYAAVTGVCRQRDEIIFCLAARIYILPRHLDLILELHRNGQVTSIIHHL